MLREVTLDGRSIEPSSSCAVTYLILGLPQPAAVSGMRSPGMVMAVFQPIPPVYHPTVAGPKNRASHSECHCQSSRQVKAARLSLS